MEIKRFFIDSSAFDGENFTITGEEFYHMTKVLRHKVGFKIIVCLNDGYDYYATITSINKDSVIAHLDEIVFNEAKTKCLVTLMQALPKGDKFDFICQKCVELGVGNIIPFTSHNTNETNVNYSRAMRIMLEACKQCGRSRISHIDELTTFDGIVKLTTDYDLVLMAYEHESVAVLGNHMNSIESANNIAIIIGSEGGFTEEEYNTLKSKGVKTFSLGKRILRAETASIVACSLLMYLKGEMNL